MPRHTPPRPQPWRQQVDGGVAEIVPDNNRPYAAELYVNGAPQSHVDLAEPDYLCYEYVQHITDVLDVAFPPRAPVDVLHLGGGALTLPRYLAASRPRSRQRVVEVDAQLVTLVRNALPLPPRHGITVSTGDARQALDRVRPASYDAIVVDVFAGPLMPASLASREAFGELAEALRPGGTLVVNLADGKALTFARALVATARDVLAPLRVVVDAQVWRGRRFGNLVLIASGCPDLDQPLRRRLAGGPFPARLIDDPELARFAADATVMTDATAVGSPLPPADTFS
ncbi:MAG: spermine synthase [Streptosporangiales bacterium]|nr:spermine synthase [Streptosporangiales bacterium]